MTMTLLLLVTLVIAFYTDLKSMKIPNWLTVGASAAGLFAQCLLYGWSGFMSSVIGLISGFVVVFGLHLVGAVGAGDVKFFAAVGALSNVSFVMCTLTFSIFFAALIGGIILVVRRERAREILFSIWDGVWMLIWLRDSAVLGRWKSGEAIRFPFMAAVLPAALTAFGLN